MSLRYALRHAPTPPCRGMRMNSTAKCTRQCSVTHRRKAGIDSRDSSSKSSTGTDVSAHSALQQQELGFCCLLCGWDVACGTCPFDWFGFDPRKFREQRQQRRRRGRQDSAGPFGASPTAILEAMAILDVTPTSSADPTAFTEDSVKLAFRAKALEWHPDCNPDPAAEEMFKRIVDAYELLVAHAR